MPSSGTRNIVLILIGIIILGIGLGLSSYHATDSAIYGYTPKARITDRGYPYQSIGIGLAVAGIAIMAFGLTRTDISATLSHIVTLFRETSKVLKYVIYLAALVADSFVILTCALLGGKFYGVLGIALFATITQSPILYLLIKDMRRKDRMLPRSEAYETLPQEFKQALEEYVGILEKKVEDDEKTSKHA
jgi:hypothetical protein